MECDDAPDLATSEASEPTTQASPLVPLFFAQVAVGVGPAAVAAPTICAQLLAASLRPVRDFARD
eukprot:COSAG05_NODE_311_length_11636_cov_11.922250_22_plen_65_part_00